MFYILLSTLFVCMMFMFLYLHRRITKSGLSEEFEKLYTKDLTRITSQLEQVKNNTDTLDVYASSIFKEVQDNLELITQQNSQTHLATLELQNMLTTGTQIIADINEKQHNTTQLLQILEDANAQEHALKDNIMLHENTYGKMNKIVGEAQDVLQRLNALSDTLKDESQKVLDQYTTELRHIADGTMEFVTGQLESATQKKQSAYKEAIEDFEQQGKVQLEYMHTQFESQSHTIKNDMARMFQDLHTTYAGNVTTLQEHMHIQSQGLREELDEIYKTYYEKYLEHHRDLRTQASTLKDEAAHSYRMLHEEYMTQHAETADLITRQCEDAEKKIMTLADMCDKKEEETSTLIEEKTGMFAHALHAQLEEYKVKGQDLQASMGTVYAELQDKVQAMYSEFDTMIGEKSNEITVNYTDAYNSLHDFVDEAMAKLSHTAEQSHIMVLENTQSKQDSIDAKLVHMEQSVEKQLTDLYALSEKKYDFVLEKVNEMVSVTIDAEKSSIDKISAVNVYASEMHKQLKNDYENLRKDYEAIADKAYQMNAAQQSLELTIKDQLSEKHQDYVNTLHAFVRTIEAELEKEVNAQKKQLQSYFHTVQEGTHTELDAIKQEFYTTLTSEKDKFMVDFEHVTQTLLQDINANKKEVDDILSDTTTQFHDKIQEFHTTLEKFDQSFLAKLSATGESILTEYVNKFNERTEGFNSNIKEVKVQMDKLQTSSKENIHKVETQFIDIRKFAEEQRTEYEESIRLIKANITNVYNDMEKSNGVYDDFMKKFSEVNTKYDQLMIEQKSLDTYLIKFSNLESSLSSISVEHANLYEKVQQHNTKMRELEQALKKSVADHKASLLSMKNVQRDLNKTNKTIALIEGQSSNLDLLKENLIDIHNKQLEIKQYQDELKKWDKDYAIINAQIDDLYHKNQKFIKDANDAQHDMEAWKPKIAEVNKEILSINEKFGQLQALQDTIDSLNADSIMNNLEEYREMQESIDQKNITLQNTLYTADQKLKTLGTVLGQPKVHKGQKSKALSSNYQKSILQLKQLGWDAETIAQSLNITTGEVHLVLQKSTVS